MGGAQIVKCVLTILESCVVLCLVCERGQGKEVCPKGLQFSSLMLLCSMRERTMSKASAAKLCFCQHKGLACCALEQRGGEAGQVVG